MAKTRHIRPRTADEMRELDRRAIEEYGIPGVVLMENAGRAAAHEVAKIIPRAAKRKVLIFCGKGNNGGDGFVIARHLHNQGVAVKVYLTGSAAHLLEGTGDAQTNLRIILNMGLGVREIHAAGDVPRRMRAGVIVDALLGTGISGEVREPFRTIIRGINRSRIPVLAVDTPSGLSCDTGEVLGEAVIASRTVTFAAPKKGFFTKDGPRHVGKLVVADIGMPRELLNA